MKKRLFLELSLGLLFIVSIASFIYAGGLLPNNRNQEKVKINWKFSRRKARVKFKYKTGKN